MAKKTFANIQAGDTVKISYVHWGTVCDFQSEFLGFTSVDEKYSEKPVFNNLKAVKQHYNVKNAKQIESIHPEYGHSVCAVFKDGNQVWCAYLFEGKWCLGTSANAISLSAVATPISLKESA